MVSAQTPSQKTFLAASKLSDAMRQDGVNPAIITSSEAGTPENFKPRKSSPPAKRTGTGASGTAKTATGGAPKNIGDTLALPNGKVLILCEDGELHERGEVLEDSDGNRFEVKADGTIRFKSGPPAPPANDGEVTAGVTTVVNSIDNMYRKLEDGRLVVTGDVRVIDPSGDATATGSTKGKLEKYQLEENGPWYYDDPVTHRPTLVPKEAYTVRQGRHDVLIGDPNSIAQTSLAHAVVQTRSGYDDSNNPTDATIAIANNRSTSNGVLGRVGSVFGVGGASCGQTVVYNQRPPAVATYGTRGGDCWRARAVWNRGR